MKRILLLLSLAVFACSAFAQQPPFMSNVYGRDYQLLNGKWNAIADLYDQGLRMEVFKNRKAVANEEFYEYSFEGRTN